MPPDDGLGFDEKKGISPIRPSPDEPGPEDPVESAELGPAVASLLDEDLVPKGENLEDEIAPAAKVVEECPEEEPDEGEHHESVSERVEAPLARRRSTSSSAPGMPQEPKDGEEIPTPVERPRDERVRMGVR
jgi:hypothetical protein